MSSHAQDFALVLHVDGSPDEFLGEIVDRLHRAGCDDATFSVRHGVPHAEFHRRARSFADAIVSAVSDLESVPGVSVRRVDLDELLTPTQIANRVGRTRQNVQQLIAGKRGPSAFPPPVPGISAGRTRLYDWTEVIRWFRDALGEPVREDRHARFVSALNAALAARHRVSQLDEPEEREAVASVVRGDTHALARR
jgi:hypothetical protein